jgi:CubicO group peptidase (beta-lactamase class C family)
VTGGGPYGQGDRDLSDLLATVAGRRSKSVAAAIVDIRASPKARFAYMGADSKTRFEIGSITKAMTGMLLADSIERGELSLSAKAGDLLEDPIPTVAGFGSVSLKELCTHTSGLPRLPRDLATILRVERYAVFGTDPHRGTTPESVLRAAAHQRLKDCGQRRYSNLGGATVGQLLAIRTGTEYGRLMRKRILDPLGLAATSVGNRENMAPGGWSARGLRRPPWSMGGFAPSGGVISTIADMARLAVALLECSAPGMESLTPIEDVATEVSWRSSGMFWNIDSAPRTDRKITWHNGRTGGYSSFIGLARHSGRAAIVLSNVSRANETQRIAMALAPAFAGRSN